MGRAGGLALLRAALTGPFAGQIAMVSSFGAESAVLLDMVASVDRRTPVVFLETGKLFPETLAYKDELVDWLRLEDVRSIRPDAGELARSDRDGRSVAARARPVLPHPQDRAAGPGLGRFRRLDHRPQAVPGRGADDVAGDRERPGHRPAQAQSIGRLVARTISGTIAGCASCRCIRWSPAAILRSAASPARGPVKEGEAVAPGGGGSWTRPSAASIAAKASEPCTARPHRATARCGLLMSWRWAGSPRFSRSQRPKPFAGLELDDLAGGDLDRFAGLRVAAFALRARDAPRTPQSRRSKPSAPCSRRPGCHAARRHRLAGFALGLAGRSGNGGIEFIQGHQLYSSDMTDAVGRHIMVPPGCKPFPYRIIVQSMPVLLLAPGNDSMPARRSDMVRVPSKHADTAAQATDEGWQCGTMRHAF